MRIPVRIPRPCRSNAFRLYHNRRSYVNRRETYDLFLKIFLPIAHASSVFVLNIPRQFEHFTPDRLGTINLFRSPATRTGSYKTFMRNTLGNRQRTGNGRKQNGNARNVANNVRNGFYSLHRSMNIGCAFLNSVHTLATTFT